MIYMIFIAYGGAR